MTSIKPLMFQSSSVAFTCRYNVQNFYVSYERQNFQQVW